MKKCIAVILMLTILFSLTACISMPFNEEPTTDKDLVNDNFSDEDQGSTNYTESPEFSGDVRDTEFTGDWLNNEFAEKSENHYTDTFRITAIYSNCFFVTPAVALPEIHKINGTLSEEWCVGDYVVCSVENMYFDISLDRYEGDLVEISASDWQSEENVVAKPVIYLYPETKTDVSVKLNLNGKLTCTYPAYNSGWRVTAMPNGTLTDSKGQTYNYLYWEGETSIKYDFSAGFCVKGEETAAFLETTLKKLGLNRKEANEFIVYWLPMMEQNPYNIITFQGDKYNNSAQLEVNPAPDTLVRVFMAWKKADSYTDIPQQELTAPKRNGFTVIEWGGTEVK